MSESLNLLESHIEAFCTEGILLAYSGGTDSSLLLAVLCRLGKRFPFPFSAIMMNSIFQQMEEIEEARNFAETMDAPFLVLDYDPLSLPELKNNPKDRCYHCKKHFFSILRDFADKNGMLHVLDGTNADDLTKYRPGKKALLELKIKSPLAECGFNKEQIREISRELGLSTADKAASPCLATRFDYGTILTPEKIRLADAGEKIVRKFVPDSKDIRLRFRAAETSIEVVKKQIPKLLEQQEHLFRDLEQLGIRNPAIDPKGYRSGSFDAGEKMTEQG